eukprot:Rhum_TRINITY_DN15139_c3_g1::Rhum_TRINITY_DN15139_c3_g1_i2::g.140079::m.140079
MAGVATFTPVDLPTDYTCPVCMEDLLPATSYVPCLHKVCAACAKRCANRCPTCKTASRPPRRDHTFSNLVEHQRRTAGYTCDVCSAAVAADARESHACADALAEALLGMAASARVSCAQLREDAHAVVQVRLDNPSMDRHAMNSMLADFVLQRAEAEGVLEPSAGGGGREEAEEAAPVPTPDSLGLAQSHHETGAAYHVDGDYDEALAWYDKACVILEEEAPDSLALAKTYHETGVVHQIKGEDDEALVWHHKALAIEEKRAPDSLDLATTYQWIGDVYHKQDRYDEALAWYGKTCAVLEQKAPDSFDLAKTCRIVATLATTYRDIGYVLELQRKNGDAVAWHKKARVMRGELDKYLLN